MLLSLGLASTYENENSNYDGEFIGVFLKKEKKRKSIDKILAVRLEGLGKE